MPFSGNAAIPAIIEIIDHFKPATILDVGVGFGKYGLLFRECLDVRAVSANPYACHKENWRTRIDGVEVFEPYITPLTNYVYDHIYLGDIAETIPELPDYDLIFLGDVLEHFHKEAGYQLLAKLFPKTLKALVLFTPSKFFRQDCSFNPFEQHRSLWQPGDFTNYRFMDYQRMRGGGWLIVLGQHPFTIYRFGRKNIQNRLIRILAAIYDELTYT